MTDEDRIISVEKKGRFTSIKKVSSTPLTEAEYERGLELLAKLVAQAYAADHPELFQPQHKPDSDPSESDTHDR